MTEPKQPQPPVDEDPTMTANALKAMAHPLRWKILCTLGDRELSVGEIVEQTGTSQSNISQQEHCDVAQGGQPDLLPDPQWQAVGTGRNHAQRPVSGQPGRPLSGKLMGSPGSGIGRD